jgi:predicted nucleic acid-binding protein
MDTEKRCWDSSVIVAFLRQEPGRVDSVQSILDMADAGQLKIYISALAISESLWPKGKKKIDKAKRNQVLEFFKRDYLIVVNVDRDIACKAQELVWDNGIKPKDAIHVATSINCGTKVLETFDDGLIKKGAKIDGDIIEIRKPTAGFPLLEGNFNEGKEEAPQDEDSEEE